MPNAVESRAEPAQKNAAKVKRGTPLYEQIYDA